MSSRLSYDDAVRVAGELFGNLFARNSDEEGFNYALKALLSGAKSPRDLVSEFMTSEEFRELHLMNQTPNEFSRRILTKLAGNKRLDPIRVKDIAVRVLEDDWRIVVAEIVRSAEYAETHGEDRVPVWV